MARGFLNSIIPLHPVSNLFRVSICLLVKIVGCLYVFM